MIGAAYGSIEVDVDANGIERPTTQVDFRPVLHPELPVEVISQSGSRSCSSNVDDLSRQRTKYHHLYFCLRGQGVHYVDYEPIEVRPGTVLHVHPGQVQGFQSEPDFDANLVVYPPDLHRTFIPGRRWFPGSDVTTHWELAGNERSVVERLVELLRKEQHQFDGSPAYVVFMEGLLTTLLARLQLNVGEPGLTQPPLAFIEFSEYLEENFRSRPTVKQCASELGYSTKTLDRACESAVGQTARIVIDERVALEVRRLLTHTSVSMVRIARTFGFDSSGFAKFVRRHFSESPSALRNG